MNKVLKCADFGTGCEAEFRGPTVDAVLELAKRHAIEAHGLTPEQAASPSILEIAAARVRNDGGS